MSVITRRSAASFLLASPFVVAGRGASAQVRELRVDYATYSPVSLVLRAKGWLEEEFKADGIAIRWVLSAGSNKALEFLNAGSLDIGSTAGAAALVARVNGNPVRAVGVFSKPEWTALVTKPDSGIAKPADLKGRRVAVTRGTDPHIFLVRAIAAAGLTERDVKVVPLQHADGRLALVRGDVDAWAGLDPIMAAAELENGATLFHRDAEANTWGILNTREAFLASHPQLVARVLQVYERARIWSLANQAELAATLAKEAKLADPIIVRQLERTDLTHAKIGPAQVATIRAAGEALQAAGVIAANVDIAAVSRDLVDASLAPRSA
ncbi:MAG: aliphatic sulfonate ABC transporter substrate-binding protein [Rhizobiales bacterium]|nr:aliphatic sulfonate ABC transporter substrate-binding protein [Hyphomicrobiales bacterium]